MTTSTKYHVHSPAAIAGGVVAACGATALLVIDGLTTGFTIDHALMPVLVGLTILTAHLAGRSLREWRLLAAIFFTFLSIFGSVLTVYETSGRRAAARDTAVATAEAENFDRVQAVADLARAKQRKADAEREIDKATADRRCGRQCGDWKLRAREVQSDIERIEAKLHKTGPIHPVDPKAERVATVVNALFGVPLAVTKAVVTTVEPFLFPLFLELGAILLFGYGVGHTQRGKIQDEPRVEASAVTLEPVPEPVTAAPADPPAPVDERFEKIAKAIGLRPFVTNDELAAALDRSKGTMSDWVDDAVDAGIVERRPHPTSRRKIAIALARPTIN